MCQGEVGTLGGILSEPKPKPVLTDEQAGYICKETAKLS